jgi:hypothetical protein
MEIVLAFIGAVVLALLFRWGMRHDERARREMTPAEREDDDVMRMIR